MPRILADIAKFLWRVHFSIPEVAYWAVIAVGAVGFSTESPTEALAWTVILLVGVQGVTRWHWHRAQSRRALVIAAFGAHGEARPRAAEASDLVFTRLRDRLPPSEAARVHRVPAVIGTADQAKAVRLRRRLRAWQLVYGRVTVDGDGWGVFARLLAPVAGIVHMDEITRDVTPIKHSWAERVDLLSPTERVSSQEYPLLAAAEVECVIRGSAGHLSLHAGDFDRAATLLEEALSIVPDSESPAIDWLRAKLADAFMGQGDIERALELLREREAAGATSPELLRTLHRVLREAARGGLGETVELGNEGTAVLRKAAEQGTDPQHDVTQFNLAMVLMASSESGDWDEGLGILRELVAASRFYRRAWYVHRTLGGAAWSEAQRTAATLPAVARELLREAGHRYKKAIRLRPRVGFFVWIGPRRAPWTIYPPAAILRSELADVHDALGRPWRAKWQWWQCERRREKLFRRGLKRFAAAEWPRAYANFDWMVMGRGDFRDVVALTYRAVAAYQYGDDEDALVSWESALAISPFALVTRAAMLRDRDGHPLERGLPGDGPTDLQDVHLLLGLPPPPPGPTPVDLGDFRRRLFPGHEPTGGAQ